LPVLIIATCEIALVIGAGAVYNELMPWIITATAAALLVVVALWIVWTSRDLPFDSAGWHAVQQRDSWRLRMAHRLVKKKTLLGKTASEVVSMLGEPSDAPWFQFSNWDLTFDLFACTFTFDSLALAVRLDEQGLVKECQIVSE
jgi:hypothetical protein